MQTYFQAIASQWMLILLTLLLLYITWDIFNKSKTGKASLKWPTVTGVVQESGLFESMENTKKHYTPQVYYTFSVNDDTYESNNLFFNAPSAAYARTTSPKEATDVINKYPIGGEVIVYYNPLKPSEACLVPGASKINYFASFIFFAITIISLVFTVRNILNEVL